MAPANRNDALVDREANDSAFTRLRNAFWPSTGYDYVIERSEPASSRSSSVSANEDYGTHPRLADLLLSKSSIALSPEYRASIFVASVTAIHAVLCTVVTMLLLLTLPRFSDEPSEDYPSPLPDGHQHPSVRAVRLWATFLGVLSTVLALLQYLPQIVLTARAKLVGSPSIPMMCIQSPGSFVFVYTLAVRPGVDWTTWGVYLTSALIEVRLRLTRAAGILQFVLLFMCIAWKARQARLGVDDYGNRLAPKTGERDPLIRRGSAPAAVR